LLNATARPLSVAEFAAALESLARFERRPFVAAAVSGGPDSLALAILADRWAKERGGEACALTVDHGLRPESGAEIARLQGWLRGRGIRHEVLLWAGAKPSSGIEEKARAARYGLLSQWCRRQGCLHLLSAHHREDQRETHLMRARAKSGADGLAAMSGVREIDGCRLLRPLLATPKSRLAATLEAEGQAFISDPSNADPRFERARLRGRAFACDGARLDAEIAAFGRERAARAQERERLLARALAVNPAGFAVVDPGPVSRAPRALGEGFFAAVLATIGVGDYPLRRERVARLLSMLAAEPERGRTLGGCRLLAWRGRILVLRELGCASPPLRLDPGSESVWDRRFRVASRHGAAAGLMIGYLGQAGRTAASLRAPKPLVPPILHAVLPAFWDEEGLVAVLALGYRREGRAALPRLSFRPIHPLSSAAFTVV
jgi:tRNA(Ile)-lysidine synthase